MVNKTQPKYCLKDRDPKRGELVQCLITGDVWNAAFLLDNGDVVIGQEVAEDGGVDVMYLEFGAYKVLEKQEKRKTLSINL